MDKLHINDTAYNLLRYSVAQHRAKTAITFYGNNISYRSFMKNTDAFARGLKSLGADENSVVTLCMPNIPQNGMAFYAVNKIGAISDILHPLISAKSLLASMKRTGSKILITTDGFLAKNAAELTEITVVWCRISAYMSAPYGIGYRLLDKSTFDKRENYVSFSTLLKNKNTENSPCLVPNAAKRVACYLHSGGTMGEPKTVMISNAALNRPASKTDYYYKDLNICGMAMYSVLPCFHGFGLSMNMHLAMISGMRQIMIAKFDAKAAVRLIKKYKIAVIHGVPTIFNALLAQPDFTPENVGSLLRCYVGGDSVPQTLSDRFDRAVCADGERKVLFAGYGLTETVAVCAVGTVEFNRDGSCGKSLPGNVCEVIENGVIMPRGTKGELCVAADSIMSGYFRDEKATALTLREHDGKIWVHTGDWGYVDEDGYIYFIQRIKHIIIRKGENIFPNEIEKAVESLDFVEKCIVVGKESDDGISQSVCAYVKVETDSDRTDENVLQIKNAVETQVSKIAVPETVTFVNDFPITLIGKIDAKALSK